MSQRNDVEPEVPDETDDRVQRNLSILADAMDYYRDHYWPFYQRYGFTFAEGWAAYKSDMNWEEKEPWEQ